MTTALTGLGPVYAIPSAWPEGLPPELLSGIDLPTPFLAGDLRMVADRFRRFGQALPRVRPHYAVKCNSAPEILRTAAAEGAGFEVASLGELRMLQDVGVDPADVLYSNTVKPAGHVAAAATPVAMPRSPPGRVNRSSRLILKSASARLVPRTSSA